MQEIRIDYGVSTPIEIDLSEFDFTGISKVFFCIRNRVGPKYEIKKGFTAPEVYVIEITPDESVNLCNGAVYDFTLLTEDGKIFKNGDNGKIYIRYGVNRHAAD